jgi:hypothetical protein
MAADTKTTASTYAAMIDRHRSLHLALLTLTFALLLAACAQSDSSSWPRGYDPYHYRQPFQAGA